MKMFFFLLVLFLSTFNDQNGVSGATSHHSCNQYDVCLPGAEDIAVHPRTITASNTCGDDPAYRQYCLGTTCTFVCDNSSDTNKHPAQFMIDSNLTTWWQSQTWWEWYDRSQRRDPLAVNITLSFNKSYVISGEVDVRFKSAIPSKMVLEKSDDHGETYKPLQYYAADCLASYNMTPSQQNCSSDEVLCTERFSTGAGTQGSLNSLYFSFLNCYTTQTFWDSETQKMTNATDLRLQLEVPYLDGQEILTSPSSLNKYFYAIADIKVFGRCQCNGHAPNCKFSEGDSSSDGKFLNTPQCLCRHYTTGTDCEKCLPLYNNKTWMPATSSDQPNPCEKCECYDHAESCVFNQTLDHGVCENCKHSTTGHFCQRCDEKFYRNFTKSLNDPEVCLDCDCAVEGITNNGTCSQEQSTAGQCLCRQNVTGRRCDRCNDTYYGYTLPPVGTCTACECNMYGTVNGSLSCNQTTGQCSCKPNIDVRTCSECKLGFHSFPNNTQTDCLQCLCDPGGSTEDICEQVHGKCLCRNGIEGERCSDVTNNRFFPRFDYFLFEAEYQPGNYTLTANASALNTLFTGRGYARLTESDSIVFQVSVDIDASYSLVLRYSRAFSGLNIRILGNAKANCSSIDRNITVNNLDLNGKGLAWTSNDTLTLCADNTYSVHVSKAGPVNNLSVSIDAIVLVPKLDNLRAYKEVSLPDIESCLADYTTLQGAEQSSSKCRNVTFSTMVELFNGSLECDCSPVGSRNASCNSYGGQCLCKPGVMGRTCDTCMPGYYNLTENGCTPCDCVAIGTEELSVCDAETGQCVCKRSVVGRTCSRCEMDYFGINTGQGCEPCNCNKTGSVNGSCDVDSGACYCKPGVEDEATDKCDRCKRHYFNFTETGCLACNCDKSGARDLQCHSSSGECACKDNTLGMKCTECKNGTFGLEESNPSGCTPCFCFNRTKSCTSADNFMLSDITLQSNFTIQRNSYVALPATFTGNQLRSYGRYFEISLNFAGFNTSVPVLLRLKGSKGDAVFDLTSCENQRNKNVKYCVQLHEKFARDKTLSANGLQSILVDIESVGLSATEVGGEIVNVSMGSASKSGANGQAVHVEQCDCPVNYQSLSCGLCNEKSGFTRTEQLNSTLGQSTRAFTSCELCSCNDRSKKCDPETRECKQCRLSEGYSCERCLYGIDIATECTECLAGYWSENIMRYGCQACNCVLNNTLNHNSSVCNVTTGQCSCETFVQGGRRCERCADNYFNTSYGCKECPECYGLLQRHAEMLKQARRDLEVIVDGFDSDRYHNFSEHLAQAKRDVNDISKTAQEAKNQDKNELNDTLGVFQSLIANISDLLQDVNEINRQRSRLDSFLERSVDLTQKAYILLKHANFSLSSAKELTETVKTLALTDSKENLRELDQTLKNRSNHVSIKNARMLSETMSEVVNNASSARKDVVQHKEITIPQLQNITQSVSNSAQNAKNKSSGHLDDVDSVLSNSERVLNTAQDLSASIQENKNHLGNAQLNKTAQYFDLEKNVSDVVKDVRGEIVTADEVLTDSSELLSDAEQVYATADRAIASSEKTLYDANKTLNVLKEFRNLSRDAEERAKKSLREIFASNISSWSSIRDVRRVSESVKEALSSANEAATVAGEADKLARAENQNVRRVYDVSVDKLIKGQNSLVCSNDLMQVFKNNVTERSQSLNSLKTCPRDEASQMVISTGETLSRNEQIENEVGSTQQEVREIRGRIMKTIDKSKDPVTGNRTSTLKTEIESQKGDFELLQKDLEQLRRAHRERKVYITELRAKLEKLKAEVQDVESLRDSLKEIPPCDVK